MSEAGMGTGMDTSVNTGVNTGKRPEMNTGTNTGMSPNKVSCGGSKKNRRTLKNRIRRITFLSILISIVLFCGAVAMIGAVVFKAQAGVLSDYFSSYIAQSISSDTFLAQMGIKDLRELNPQSEAFRQWIENIRYTKEDNRVQLTRPDGTFDKSNTHHAPDIRIELPDGRSKTWESNSPYDIGELFSFTITMDESVIYTNQVMDRESFMGALNWEIEHAPDGSLMKKGLDFFNTASDCNILDADGNIVAVVTAKVNYSFIFMVALLFTLAILLAALAALIIGSLISKILTIPVTNPLCTLDQNIRAISTGDLESTMNAQIVLKKPLREIESLAESTNTIMHKMKEYNDLLMAQNEELEAQNEELAASKKQVEDAQTMLVQSENMASIGQLTAAITHEINTPLGAVNSNVQMCDMLLNLLAENTAARDNAELSEMLTQLREANNISIMACRRVSDIIRSLKNFSKIDQAEFQEADINEGLRSVLVLTSNLWKRHITIHEEYGALPQVKCYSGMLNQVFMNIVVNAIQAIEEKGDIFIKTWADEKHVHISIRDTGSGIKEEHLARIFDTGFTTKAHSSGMGMGLGLSITRNIVEKHHGEIKVNSTPGTGTEFIVSIPLNANE